MRRLPIILAVAWVFSGCGGSSQPSGGAGGTGGGGGAGAGGDAGGAGTGGAAACEPSFDAETLHLAVGAADLAPAADETLCLRWTAPEDLDITAMVGTLGDAGHHSLLLVQPGSMEPDGVAPCYEPDLMDASALGGGFQMLAGVSYETSGVPYTFPSSPVQIGLFVPKGAQLVFDAHFLNLGDFPLDACATLDLSIGKPVVAKLEFHTVLPPEEYGLVVPAAGSIDVEYTEVFPNAYRVAAASSHMHEGGTHFTMSIVETGQVLYESFDWASPEPKPFDGAPVVIQAGQTVKVACSFQNPGAVDQAFPDQMCVGGMYLLSCALPGACP